MATRRREDAAQPGGAPADGAAPAQSELEAAERRRAMAAAPLADALDAMISAADEGGTASSTWRVSRAWHDVNGDVERAATAGVYVAAPRRPGQDPVLVVYVDTRARATDFTANREIYLARLERAGLRFSELVFRPTKRPRGAAGGATAPGIPAAPAAGPSRPAAVGAGPDDAPAPLPDLTPEDEASEQALLASLSPELSDRLRGSVTRAVDLSLRRSRAQ